VDAEFSAILTGAATEAESHVGELFLAPDGHTYTGTFKAANAFDLAAAGLEMEPNGFPDRTVMALTMTRVQLANPPLSWRRAKNPLVRLSSPQQHCLVASVTADDPLFYGLILIHHQTRGPLPL
jgi:hypothetical protein